VITLWHNPRCSKSRAALALLEAAGVPVTLRRYLDAPPTRAELSDLLDQLDLPAHALIRKGEKTYKDQNLAGKTDADLLDAMAQFPILIERPIAIKGTRAIIGRPPDNILVLLD